MQVYGKAVNTFSNGELVWDGTNFLNQQKGKFIKRGTHGYTYRRHTAYTSTNDPLNFKVDRSGNDSSSTANTNATSSEVSKLRE